MTKRFKLNGKRCHQVWSSEAPRRVMLFLSYEPFFLLLLFAKQRKFVNIERFLYKELQISLLPRVRKRKLLAVVANIGDGGCLRRKMMAASKHVNSALPMDLHCKHPLRGLKISFAMREAARTEIFYGVFHPCLTFTLTVGRWRSRQRILRSSGSLRVPFDVKLFVEARAKRCRVGSTTREMKNEPQQYFIVINWLFFHSRRNPICKLKIETEKAEEDCLLRFINILRNEQREVKLLPG